MLERQYCLKFSLLFYLDKSTFHFPIFSGMISIGFVNRNSDIISIGIIDTYIHHRIKFYLNWEEYREKSICKGNFTV